MGKGAHKSKDEKLCFVRRVNFLLSFFLLSFSLYAGCFCCLNLCCNKVVVQAIEYWIFDVVSKKNIFEFFFKKLLLHIGFGILDLLQEEYLACVSDKNLKD